MKTINKKTYYQNLLFKTEVTMGSDSVKINKSKIIKIKSPLIQFPRFIFETFVFFKNITYKKRSENVTMTASKAHKIDVLGCDKQG